MPENYIGSVIHVKHIELASYQFDGKPVSTYKIDWDFIGLIPIQLQNYKSPIANSFVSDTISLNEEEYDLYLMEELETITIMNSEEQSDLDGLEYDNWLLDQTISDGLTEQELIREGDDDGLLMDGLVLQ